MEELPKAMEIKIEADDLLIADKIRLVEDGKPYLICKWHATSSRKST